MGSVYSSVDAKGMESDDAPDEVIVAPSLPPVGEKKLQIDGGIWRNIEGSKPKNLEEMKLPFKLLCDNTTQTEWVNTSSYIDDSVQTESDISESNVKFKNLYLSETSKDFSDNSVQTDIITAGLDSSPMLLDIEHNGLDFKSFSEQSVQTDDIVIYLLESFTDNFSQTEENFTWENHGIEIGIQTDLAEEIASEVWNDYMQMERESLMNYSSLENDVIDDEQPDNEWRQKFDHQEKQIKEEVNLRELLEESHRGKMDILRKQNVHMRKVVLQYEKVILELTEHTQDSQRSDAKLVEAFRDKEQLQLDLSNTETSLVDAYKRIEKLKNALDTYKENDAHLNQSFNDLEQKLQKSEDRYKKLKQQAKEKIDAANSEISKVRKQKEMDLAGIEAALKKSINRNTNLEKEIVQKIRENEELSQICDELIKKVSS